MEGGISAPEARVRAYVEEFERRYSGWAGVDVMGNQELTISDLRDVLAELSAYRQHECVASCVTAAR